VSVSVSVCLLDSLQTVGVGLAALQQENEPMFFVVKKKYTRNNNICV